MTKLTPDPDLLPPPRRPDWGLAFFALAMVGLLALVLVRLG